MGGFTLDASRTTEMQDRVKDRHWLAELKMESLGSSDRDNWDELRKSRVVIRSLFVIQVLMQLEKVTQRSLPSISRWAKDDVRL